MNKPTVEHFRKYCKEKKVKRKNWNRFYRRSLNEHSKFSRVTIFQQLLWFIIMAFTGIFGQLLFRLYFNVWGIQKIWYITIFFIFFPPLFFYSAILGSLFMMLGCFWALPLYDIIVHTLPFFLRIFIKPILDIIYKIFGWSSIVYQYEKKINYNKLRIDKDLPHPYNKK